MAKGKSVIHALGLDFVNNLANSSYSAYTINNFLPIYDVRLDPSANPSNKLELDDQTVLDNSLDFAQTSGQKFPNLTRFNTDNTTDLIYALSDEVTGYGHALFVAKNYLDTAGHSDGSNAVIPVINVPQEVQVGITLVRGESNFAIGSYQYIPMILDGVEYETVLASSITNDGTNWTLNNIKRLTSHVNPASTGISSLDNYPNINFFQNYGTDQVQGISRGSYTFSLSSIEGELKYNKFSTLVVGYTGIGQIDGSVVPVQFSTTTLDTISKTLSQSQAGITYQHSFILGFKTSDVNANITFTIDPDGWERIPDQGKTFESLRYQGNVAIIPQLPEDPAPFNLSRFDVYQDLTKTPWLRADIMNYAEGKYILKRFDQNPSSIVIVDEVHGIEYSKIIKDLASVYSTSTSSLITMHGTSTITSSTNSLLNVHSSDFTNIFYSNFVATGSENLGDTVNVVGSLTGFNNSDATAKAIIRAYLNGQNMTLIPVSGQPFGGYGLITDGHVHYFNLQYGAILESMFMGTNSKVSELTKTIGMVTESDVYNMGGFLWSKNSHLFPDTSYNGLALTPIGSGFLNGLGEGNSILLTNAITPQEPSYDNELTGFQIRGRRILGGTLGNEIASPDYSGSSQIMINNNIMLNNSNLAWFVGDASQNKNIINSDIKAVNSDIWIQGATNSHLRLYDAQWVKQKLAITGGDEPEEKQFMNFVNSFVQMQNLRVYRTHSRSYDYLIGDRHQLENAFLFGKSGMSITQGVSDYIGFFGDKVSSDDTPTYPGMHFSIGSSNLASGMTGTSSQSFNVIGYELVRFETEGLFGSTVIGDATQTRVSQEYSSIIQTPNGIDLKIYDDNGTNNSEFSLSRTQSIMKLRGGLEMTPVSTASAPGYTPGTSSFLWDGQNFVQNYLGGTGSGDPSVHTYEDITSGFGNSRIYERTSQGYRTKWSKSINFVGFTNKIENYNDAGNPATFVQIFSELEHTDSRLRHRFLNTDPWVAISEDINPGEYVLNHRGDSNWWLSDPNNYGYEEALQDIRIFDISKDAMTWAWHGTGSGADVRSVFFQNHTTSLVYIQNNGSAGMKDGIGYGIVSPELNKKMGTDLMKVNSHTGWSVFTMIEDPVVDYTNNNLLFDVDYSGTGYDPNTTDSIRSQYARKELFNVGNNGFHTGGSLATGIEGGSLFTGETRQSYNASRVQFDILDSSLPNISVTDGDITWNSNGDIQIVFHGKGAQIDSGNFTPLMGSIVIPYNLTVPTDVRRITIPCMVNVGSYGNANQSYTITILGEYKTQMTDRLIDEAHVKAVKNSLKVMLWYEHNVDFWPGNFNGY